MLHKKIVRLLLKDLHSAWKSNANKNSFELSIIGSVYGTFLVYFESKCKFRHDLSDRFRGEYFA